MSEVIVIESIKTVFALGILWAFWQYAWKDYMLDKYQQDLFSLRDKLFDEVASGSTSLTFDSPIYQRFRMILNGTLEFSHDLTMSRILIFLVLARTSGLKEGDAVSRFALDFSKVQDTAARKMLKWFQRKYSILTFWYLFLTSPLFLISTCFAYIYLVLHAALRRILIRKNAKRLLTRGSHVVEIQAFDNEIAHEAERKAFDDEARHFQPA